jgi:hypothetical protein
MKEIFDFYGIKYNEKLLMTLDVYISRAVMVRNKIYPEKKK